MMGGALLIEWWKMRKSPVTLVATILMGILLPAMGLSFYLVAVNGGNGAIADKAAALLTANGWDGYLRLVDQVAAAALFLGAGVVVAWVFGREHVDRTFSSLFARAISTGTVAAAKHLLVFVWVVALSTVVSLAALILGWIGGVGPVDSGVIAPELARLFVISNASGLLGLTIGLIASMSRGYLAAIGALIVITALAQVSVLFGAGGWFPYAVPGLLAVSGTEGIPEVSGVQLALGFGWILLSGWLTVRWWQHAEAS